MSTSTDPSQASAALLALIKEKGYRRLDEPVRLASGEFSRDFIDGKTALARGADLALACSAMAGVADAAGAVFDAAGGLTMGADPFAHGIAIVRGDCGWFSVRKEPKGRGTNRMTEGTALGAGTRVLLVDDVVTTGGSIQRAYEAVVATGAQVVCATTLVDRGDTAAGFFQEVGVPYHPLLTYRDFDIEPVGRSAP